MSWFTRVASVLATLTLLLTAFGAGLAAQGESEFVPVTGDDIITENLPATPLVFAAYAAVWVGLLIYVFTLWRRLVRVERELAEVTATLDAKSR